MMVKSIYNYITRYQIQRDYAPTRSSKWNGRDPFSLITSHHFPVYEQYVNCEQFQHKLNYRVFKDIILKVITERIHAKYIDNVGVHVSHLRTRPLIIFIGENFGQETWDDERDRFFRDFPLNIDKRP